MTTNAQSLDLSDAQDRTHFVRFYQDEVVLLAEVADFLDRGLRSSGAAIVIATGDHLSALRQQLMGLGSVQGQRNWFPGRLITLDAADALAQFMVDGWPDEQRFDEVIGSVVRKATVSGKLVHAYGEMVALLCEKGLYDAAVRLEQLWNDLRKQCHFSLFCAYPWQLFPTENLALAFHRICCEHDHVCPNEYDVPEAQHDVNLQLAILEQKNLALRGEVARAREAEQTLRHREREFADFVENAAEGLHRVAPDGTILWANKAELAMLGYRWEEYVGHHIATFHADRPVIEDILSRLLKGETLHDRPARLLCKDGTIKHVVISSNGCFENGQLRYTRCFTRDATERHLLEQMNQEREVLLAELTRTNRAKDQFLAMLAHELRNPLAPISAAAQLLELVVSDPKQVAQAAAVITRQVEHMKRLVDDLLDVARVTRGLIVLKKNPIDLRDVVSAAVEQVTPQIRARQHRLVLDVPPEAAVVSGDRERIVQVVANILANAAKFTPEGGEIWVRLVVATNRVELSVSDNGVGINAELVGQVFDLFAQGDRTPDRTQGGLGIGLALAKSLVEAHGGDISAASDGAGQGSTFTIRLPGLQSDAPASGSRFTSSLPQAIGTSLDVIVVDDNCDAADALADLLSTMGHRARALYSALSALEVARLECPQVFLLDIGLPELDGIALAGRIRALPEAAQVVLIAVTGYGQERDKELTKAAGFAHHLVKPVGARELSDLLRQIAARDSDSGANSLPT